MINRIESSVAANEPFAPEQNAPNLGEAKIIARDTLQWWEDQRGLDFRHFDPMAESAEALLQRVALMMVVQGREITRDGVEAVLSQMTVSFGQGPLERSRLAS